MTDRLSPLDASFLYLEGPSTPLHVGSVAVFAEPEGGFDHDRLVALVGERIAHVPRYRQRVRHVPGRIGAPVWVDDAGFDLAYHVRRSALPRPGTLQQLADFVARTHSRRLDRSHPLWEVYLVEGLADGRFAVVTKAHQTLVDGVDAVDIAQVLLDTDPTPRDAVVDTWRPAREPSAVELVVGAVEEAVRRPGAVIEAVRGGVDDLRGTADRVSTGVRTVLRSTARAAPTTSLNAPVGEGRRFAMVDTDLEDYRRVRAAHGGSVNDVALAVVSGALRAWMLTRGDPMRPSTVVRALVPVSVRADEGTAGEPAGDPTGGRPGGRVTSHLVDLPVGEANPVVRLHRLSFQLADHRTSGRAVGADVLTGLAGFAPPTLHSLGVRVASRLSGRLANLVVTNVPGPQQPLYADGARLLAAYPVTPVTAGRVLSVGLTSYDGTVFFGLHADRDAMPDLDVLAQCVREALAELVGTVRR